MEYLTKSELNNFPINTTTTNDNNNNNSDNSNSSLAASCTAFNSSSLFDFNTYYASTAHLINFPTESINSEICRSNTEFSDKAKTNGELLINSDIPNVTGINNDNTIISTDEGTNNNPKAVNSSDTRKRKYSTKTIKQTNQLNNNNNNKNDNDIIIFPKESIILTSSPMKQPKKRGPKKNP
ncbi:unnamed protein product [Heterobilharzia americana]|nr:unnamed protein product [Heterobilharzia americana]